MLTIGISCPPLAGHLNPMLAVGEELRRRGHRVIVLNVEDVSRAVQARQLGFAPLGRAEFPVGSIPAWLLELQKRGWSRAVPFTVKLLAKHVGVLLREADDVIRSTGIDGLLIDQGDYAGSTIAESVGVPFVTMANAFPLNREPGMPSMYTAWQPATTTAERLRDKLVYEIHERGFRHSLLGRSINRARKQRGLQPHRRENDSYSSLAQLSQCPEVFDFPRRELPPTWHGLGPLRSEADSSTPFPFERLDGRPLAYVSLGSMQGNRRAVFAAIAEACAPLDMQLVITHGHQLSAAESSGFAGDPVVVPYAPQRQLLERASLVVTHAGMNTVLDALSAGVPLVTIPITFEQPAIAARVAWHGAGEVVPLRRASVARLRLAVRRVLEAPRYRESAKRLSRALAATGGVERAAEVIEQALSTRRPVVAAPGSTYHGPSALEASMEQAPS